MQLFSSLLNFVALNWALCSIIATVAVLLFVPHVVLQKYVRISLNIFTDTEPPLSMSQVSHARLPGDEVDFWSADGLRLRGVFMHPASDVPRKGLVLFAPEFKSDRHSCARYCLPLLRAGYDVFSIDFRGHGHAAREDGYTPRQWPSDREMADMRGAFAYLRNWLEEQGRPAEIGLFGISRGASAGVLAAATEPMVRCIVTDGAFSSDAALEYLMRRWAYIFAKVKFVYENHPPEFWMFLRRCMVHQAERRFGCIFPSLRRSIRKMPPRPVLFIHGERDSYIPVEQSRILYAQAPQPRYLWIVPNAKHNQSVAVRPDEYARRTVDFFDRFLAGCTRPDNLYQTGSFAEWIQTASSPPVAVMSEGADPLAAPDLPRLERARPDRPPRRRTPAHERSG